MAFTFDISLPPFPTVRMTVCIVIEFIDIIEFRTCIRMPGKRQLNVPWYLDQFLHQPRTTYLCNMRSRTACTAHIVCVQVQSHLTFIFSIFVLIQFIFCRYSTLVFDIVAVRYRSPTTTTTKTNCGLWDSISMCKLGHSAFKVERYI